MARRVFFSFHYQDVLDFRANVVRKHHVAQGDDPSYFDASIWESAKRQGSLAQRRLINGGLERTTATAVLIGSETYARPWVRYEIFKSLERDNKTIGVHINGILDRYQRIKVLGANPFEYLALEISADGQRATPTE